MNYHIKLEGEIIASFKEISDRNYCLDDMRERYDDCNFEAVTDE